MQDLQLSARHEANLGEHGVRQTGREATPSFSWAPTKGQIILGGGGRRDGDLSGLLGKQFDQSDEEQDVMKAQRQEKA